MDEDLQTILNRYLARETYIVSTRRGKEHFKVHIMGYLCEYGKQLLYSEMRRFRTFTNSEEIHDYEGLCVLCRRSRDDSRA